MILFQNPLSIALAIVGANLPDFDHKFKKDQVLGMYVAGVLIFLALYLFNHPYYLGLVLMLIATIFFFSSHRGFTHSFLGIAILTLLVSIMIYLGFCLANSFDLRNVLGLINIKLFIIAIMIIFLAILSLNKKILTIFISLFLISLVAFPNLDIGFYEIIFSIFLGLLSHLILDSITPSGIKPFVPFSNKKYHKDFAIISLIFVFALFILIFPEKINYFLNFIFKSF